jgi:adenylosuccinate lyase
MRERGLACNDLFERLAADDRLGLSRAELDALVTEPLTMAGTAQAQVASLVAQIAEIAGRHPEAAAYRPGDVL